MVVLRAGLYERVSTEEQAKFGYSIKTQIDGLTEYCQKNKIKIVDHYTEEGVSGGKPSFKRPQMARLLEDVKAGKIDIILFTKLDRWFRNVKEYFKVQEILDEHKVEWKAIHEDYDTTSSNGRMAITIFLAIAQAERERGSERSKVVLENKWKNKEATFGAQSTPFGYMKQKDENGIPRLVKNPELQDAVQEFWDILVKYESFHKAFLTVNRKYGLTRLKKLWYDVSQNEIYTGTYKGVVGFCEPYVSAEDFKRLQSRKVKKAQASRIYLFSGLMRCPKCGARLAANYTRRKLVDGSKREYYFYRCPKNDEERCDAKINISQRRIENWLLSNLEEEINGEIARVEIERTKPKPRPKVNISALKEQLRRLEVVYMAGNKPDEEYLAEQNEIKELIAKAESEQHNPVAEKDLSPLKELLETDFKSIYETFNDEDKRRFWRSIIEEIKVDGSNVIAVNFL